ncbi:hypothetical protein, partial [Propionibacterium freudenreichii]|uniref:hypothetical protein n=1 Tax=Propionibacterium freudenreichii TaxID=1744 RepID=UPI0038537285
EQEKAELRQIEKEIEREESVKALKVKHGITGTLEEQKEKIEEKKEEILYESENKTAEDVQT